MSIKQKLFLIECVRIGMIPKFCNWNMCQVFPNLRAVAPYQLQGINDRCMEKLWYMGVMARTNGACRCDLMYWMWKSRLVIMVFSRRLNYSQKATFANSKAYIWAYRAVFNYLYLFFVSRNTIIRLSKFNCYHR